MEDSCNKLPTGWIKTSLGQVCPIKYGKARSNSHGLPHKDTPVVGSSGIIGAFDRALTTCETLVVGRKGNVGAVHYLPNGCWPIDTVYYTEEHPSTHLKFFKYLLEKLQLGKLDRSTAVPGLSRDDYDALEVMLPGLHEQRRIVAKIEELFSELDNSVASLKLAQEQLKVYRQAVLKYAFEGKLTARWREKNKKRLVNTDILIERIKTERAIHAKKQCNQSNKTGKANRLPKSKQVVELAVDFKKSLPELPSGWFWGQVNDITLGSQYGSSAKSQKTGTCPVLRMGNIQNGEFDWADIVYTSNEEEIQQYLLREGDVLFNRTNSPELVGKTAIFRGERQSIFAGYLIRINHIRTISDSDYLNYFLNSPIARLYGDSVKTDGVNQSNINGSKLVAYPFPMCSLEEQQEIARILVREVSHLDYMELTLRNELERSKALRQSILKKAFEGNLVPQDPEDEYASILLERIRAEHSSNRFTTRKKSKSRRHK